MHRFAADGSLLQSWGTPGKSAPGEFHVPHGVWVHTDGRVFVADRVHRELATAADKLCAYLKCLEERGAGNPQFAKAEKPLRASVDALALPEVRYFLDTFVPSFRLTLDDLE